MPLLWPVSSPHTWPFAPLFAWMPEPNQSSSDGFAATLLRSRVRVVVAVVVFCVTFLIGLGGHLLAWYLNTASGPTATFLFQVNMLICYGTLWLLLARRVRSRHAPPARVFWNTMFAGALFVGLGYLVARFGRPPNLDMLPPGIDVLGFDHDTGVPLAWATVVKMNLLSLLAAAFVFVLLLRFRDLVLVKRTRSSQRNWYLMLGLMVVAALFEFMKPATVGTFTLWQQLALIPPVVFMVVNALRLSWIVFLSFKEKMLSIGLCFVLLVLLFGMGIDDDISLLGYDVMPGVYAYLRHYSYPLATFVALGVFFGILYCTTALLSLLFHLPTTGDFQQKAGEVAAMHSLTHLVNQVLDPKKLFASVAATPVEAGSAQAAWLAVADADTGTLRPQIVATHGITLTRVNELVDVNALYQEALTTPDFLLLDQAPADHRISARPGDGLGSLLVMPLNVRNETLGALFVAKEVTHGFEQDDIAAISVFAAQAVLALDNARLLEERIERERLAREMSIAREVQQKLLPQSLPAPEGLSIAAASVSALEVGGDYYDFIELEDDRLGFIVADVSGKGTSAAFYMAEMQGIFHSVSRLAPSPVDFLAHANQALAGSLDKNVFISGIYGTIDLKREELTLARAGHCPAARISLAGEATLLSSKGMGLGLDRGSGVLFRRTICEECHTLRPGDVFVLYTDGVVESRSPAGEEYGYDRLLKALQNHRHEDADDLHQSLLADLHAFMGNKEYDDDMTLVVLKWHGVALPHTAQTEQASAENGQPALAEVEVLQPE